MINFIKTILIGLFFLPLIPVVFVLWVLQCLGETAIEAWEEMRK